MARKLSFSYVIVATLLGNTLEWYEYACFSFLSPILAKLFYPQEDPRIALIQTMLGLAFGYLFRPLGGILFGYIGDRFGRKIALISSVLFMSFPTLCIGLLPTYFQIGISATLLLSLFRLLQGFAAGGEFPGSITFLVESAPEDKKIFFGGFAFFGVALGILIGAVELFIFSKETLSSGGWRYMYLFGAVLGCIAFFMRYFLHETSPFQKMKEAHEIQKQPILLLFRRYKKQIFTLIGLELLETTQFNLVIAFFITYSTEIVNLSFSEASYLCFILLIFLTGLIPVCSWIGSKLGARKLASFAALGTLLFAFPLYFSLLHEGTRWIFSVGFAFLTAAYMAPLPAIYCSLFPTEVRLSGIGFSFNATVGFIGGFLPILALSLIEISGSSYIPSFCLMGMALLSLILLNRHKP